MQRIWFSEEPKPSTSVFSWGCSDKLHLAAISRQVFSSSHELPSDVLLHGGI
jgi:hypothetical protein